MIKCDIKAQKYEVSDELKKYTLHKLGRLDRFLPRHARKSAHLEVVLLERQTKSDRYECEAILTLPKDRLTAKESTLNMFAAVDIVEAKLKNQVLKYKTRDEGHKKFGSGYHRAAIKRAIMRRRFSSPGTDGVDNDNPDKILNK